MDGNFSKLNVLIVDDDRFVRATLTSALKSLGIVSVSEAGNGNEAVELLEENKFSLVLCDLNMPDMDGLSFLRHLAGVGFLGSVLVISSEDERILRAANTLAEAFNLNLLGALPKPVTAEALKTKLSLLEKPASIKSFATPWEISKEALQHGINNDEIVVYYQPKVSTKTRELVGVEALVRWQHPKHGLVPPGRFVPLAERQNLIVDLTDIVIQKSLLDGQRWHANGLPIKISINLSVDCLERLDLPELIADCVAAAGLKPSSIILELTESRVMEDILNPLEVLSRLAMKGFVLSIDDFGTGYSSMEKLTQFPFGELKLDRAFVHNPKNDPIAQSILESSVDLAKKLDLSVVAEGVENQNDWDVIAGLGVDLVQGFFVAKPMPAEEIPVWAKNWLS